MRPVTVTIMRKDMTVIMKEDAATSFQVFFTLKTIRDLISRSFLLIMKFSQSSLCFHLYFSIIRFNKYKEKRI